MTEKRVGSDCATSSPHPTDLTTAEASIAKAGKRDQRRTDSTEASTGTLFANDRGAE